MNKIKVKLSIALIFVALEIFASSSNKCNSLPFDSKDNRISQLDTIFTLDYYYPFAVHQKNNLNEVYVVSKGNTVLRYAGSLWDTLFKVENSYFMEHLFVSDDFILLGNGTSNEIQYLFVYGNDSSYRYKLNLVDRFVNSFQDTIALCSGDYTHKKSLSMIEQLITYHYLLDVKNKDTIYQFKDRNLVAESFGVYYEFNINTSLRNGAKLKVTKHENLISSTEIEIFFPKNVIPIHFGENYYLSKRNGEIRKYNFNAELLNSFEIAPKYYSRIVYVDQKMEIYGWLNTDLVMDEYHFVRQVYALE